MNTLTQDVQDAINFDYERRREYAREVELLKSCVCCGAIYWPDTSKITGGEEDCHHRWERGDLG